MASVSAFCSSSEASFILSTAFIQSRRMFLHKPHVTSVYTHRGSPLPTWQLQHDTTVLKASLCTSPPYTFAQENINFQLTAHKSTTIDKAIVAWQLTPSTQTNKGRSYLMAIFPSSPSFETSFAICFLLSWNSRLST